MDQTTGNTDNSDATRGLGAVRILTRRRVDRHEFRHSAGDTGLASDCGVGYPSHLKRPNGSGSGQSAA